MTRRHFPAALLAASCALASPARSAPATIWFEAESAASTNFPTPESGAFAPANAQEAEVLSGGQWMSAGGDRAETLFLEYKISAPQTAKYNFYARKFWHHGPFRFRFDAGPWREVRSHSLLDEAGIRQFLGANWVGVGEVQLANGAHTLRIELLEKTGAAAFDAFVLSTGGFVARGKLKPGEKLNRAQAGYFPFEPDQDDFRPTPLDLRRLNEKLAGENGFIQARGEDFVHGRSGRPVRFWAINSGGDVVNLDPASMRLMARSLAKQGVNMVRLHGAVWKGDNWREFDPEHGRKIQAFVRALKREGIYTALSIYFPLWVRPDASLAGYAGDKNPFATLFFNPEFQAVYRNWWRQLLTTPDPETGVALKDEPAVALAEMVNEDSYLFWTFKPYDSIPKAQIEILEREFGAWLAERYGTLGKAFDTYRNAAPVTGDDEFKSTAGFRPLWELSSNKDRRSQDTAEFLTLHQRKFFAETHKYLRGLGFKSAIYGSNWMTADARVLGPLDKYANTVGDSMDRHGYFSGAHQGERAGYSISAGDRYADRSALLLQNAKGEPDFDVPIFELRHNDLPSTITEVNWTPPNRFRAEFPLLMAAYGALQGNDGAFFFATTSPSWEQSLGKFSIRTPAVAGQFPAAALIYRLGLVKPAAHVVDVNLKLPDLFALKGAPVSAPVNLDELRARDIPPGQTASVAEVASIDPLSFAVGKVGLRYSESGGPSKLADLSRYIDRQKKIVRSQTGELSWNWGSGLLTIDAPQAQAATGFLGKAGEIKLRDVSFSSPLEYGAITLVSLDGQPIARSRSMLLQVMSEESNFGWQTRAGANGLQEIESLGSAPLTVKNLSGTVALKRADATRLRVTALDFNGYPAQAVGAARSIALRPGTLYYLIEAAGAAAQKR